MQERPRVQGFFSAVWGTASLAGPALGAFLVNTFGWRSIFFVNLPFGALGLLVLIWKYHDREKPHSTDLDLPGVLSLAVACTAALTVASSSGQNGLPWLAEILLAVVAIGATALFIVNERRAANPILPPALMVKRAIGPSLIGSFLLGMLFNILIRPQLQQLHRLGINPADLMDPHSRQHLDPVALHTASGMIAGGLTWVFVAMLVFAVFQTIATFFMSGKKAEYEFSTAEAMEALAG